MDNLFLICGDDEFLITQEVEKIKSKYDKLEKGINFLTFDKDNMQYLSGELTTYSFFSAPKLIIVKIPRATKKENDDSKEAETKEEKEEREAKEAKAIAWFSDELKEQIINRIDNIELVFVEIGKPRVAVQKFFTEYGKIINVEKGKLPVVIKNIIDYANSKNLKISKEDANYFSQIVAGDIRSAYNTIDILQDYVESGIITRNDIDTIGIKTSDVIIFNLTDNLGIRNRAAALQNLDELLKINEPIQKILIMITRHFKNLLLTKECIESSYNVQKELSLKFPFQAQNYSNQSKNFTKEELKRIFKELYKLDIDVKTYPVDVKIALQRIIML